ncbi:MAG TPA: hypothetical protein VK602_13770 [Phyllobacterium sp.]|nr:hypothetical protein [Phyllobacterium sp.]
MNYSMIERVGRALAKEEGYAYDPFPYDARARAAIEAMREPTEAMVRAGAAILGSRDRRIVDFEADAELTLEAMIDEALRS